MCSIATGARRESQPISAINSIVNDRLIARSHLSLPKLANPRGIR